RPCPFLPPGGARGGVRRARAAAPAGRRRRHRRDRGPRRRNRAPRSHGRHSAPGRTVNFFAHQNRARRRTWLLALLFSLAVAATVLLANLVVLALVAFYASDAGASLAPLAWARAHPGAAASTTAGTLGFVLGASLLRMA